MLCGGRKAQLGYLSLIGMHIGLLPFGWVPFTFWAVPMLVTFVLLFRAEGHHHRQEHDPLIDARDAARSVRLPSALQW